MSSKTLAHAAKPASSSLTIQAQSSVPRREVDKQAENPLQQPIWQPNLHSTGTAPPSPPVNTGHNFATIPVLSPVPTPIQAKLTVGEPNDKYEQEADQVAEQVMRMPEPTTQGRPDDNNDDGTENKIQTKPISEQITPLVQRQSDAEKDDEEERVQTKPLIQRQEEPEEEEVVQTKSLIQKQEESEEEEEPVQAKLTLQRQKELEEEPVQTKAVGKTPKVKRDNEDYINNIRGQGQPLSRTERDFFEPRFDHNFGRVRVHANSKAASAARQIKAQAFTVDCNIFFGANRYQPRTRNGRQLLAHELTHTVQQKHLNINNKLNPYEPLSSKREQPVQRKINGQPDGNNVGMKGVRRKEEKGFFQAKARRGHAPSMMRSGNMGRDTALIDSLTSKAATAQAPPSGDGKPLGKEARATMEAGFGRDLGNVRIHDDITAKNFVENRGAYAVTFGHNIYMGETDPKTGSDGYKRLLAHEIAHTIQQNSSGLNSENVDLNRYQKLEQEADNASDQVLRKERASLSPRSVGTIEQADGKQDITYLNHIKAAASNQLGPFYLYLISKITSLDQYKSVMKKLVNDDANFIKGKLYEDWVDDDDEQMVINTLSQWSKIPRVEGGNYLDDILNYLKQYTLVMDYGVTESAKSTFLDQLFEDMEGPRKKKLHRIVDTYSFQYRGYRGRGGVSIFGSIGTAVMPSTVKNRISRLNTKLSGLTTVPMTEGEVKKINALYKKLKNRTFGLVNLPRITMGPDNGQQAAPALAIPIAGVAAILYALLMAILVTIALALIIAILIELEKVIDRAISKTKERAKPRTKERAKPRRRRRRKKPKPLKWNPAFTRSTVIASGGVPGILDTTGPLPSSAPIHGHHVWPKYVGGPVKQPLMGIRDIVHLSIVHPTLHAVMAAAALGMGYTIVPNATNTAFVRHLRRDLKDRTLFAAALTAYYVGLNLITSPPIPAPAYALGIASSLPRI